MSVTIGKKPRHRDAFVRQLSDAITVQIREKKGRPTIAGTARLLEIHRDTLYEWMKEFKVSFSQIQKETVKAVLTEITKMGKFTEKERAALGKTEADEKGQEGENGTTV